MKPAMYAANVNHVFSICLFSGHIALLFVTADTVQHSIFINGGGTWNKYELRKITEFFCCYDESKFTDGALMEMAENCLRLVFPPLKSASDGLV